MTFLRLLASCLAIAGTLGVSSAHAQKIYKSIGPDGKVVFSDRAPDSQAPPVTVGSGQSAANNTVLPYALRQITARYPVRLYTSKDCSPCDSARNLLVQRGVPFTEKTVDTNDDIEALKRLSGSNGLPFGTVGGQHIKGFSDAEWNQNLDAAGYPQQSQLPANYQHPVATPLVAVKQPKAAPASKKEEAQPETPPPAPSNPNGIIF